MQRANIDTTTATPISHVEALPPTWADAAAAARDLCRTFGGERKYGWSDQIRDLARKTGGLARSNKIAQDKLETVVRLSEELAFTVASDPSAYLNYAINPEGLAEFAGGVSKVQSMIRELSQGTGALSLAFDAVWKRSPNHRAGSEVSAISDCGRRATATEIADTDFEPWSAEDLRLPDEQDWERYCAEGLFGLRIATKILSKTKGEVVADVQRWLDENTTGANGEPMVIAVHTMLERERGFFGSALNMLDAAANRLFAAGVAVHKDDVEQGAGETGAGAVDASALLAEADRLLTEQGGDDDEARRPYVEANGRFVEAPVATREDAVAKLIWLNRAFTAGETGDEPKVVAQLLDFLGVEGGAILKGDVMYADRSEPDPIVTPAQNLIAAE